jgi:uncharacterized MAPEG superfamily protein
MDKNQKDALLSSLPNNMLWLLCVYIYIPFWGLEAAYTKSLLHSKSPVSTLNLTSNSQCQGCNSFACT